MPALCICVNDLIDLIIGRCDLDGILEWLHGLIYMDYTVLLSTAREGMHYKLSLIQEWCINNAVKENTNKIIFFAINGLERDRVPFILKQFNVECCDKYIYSGSSFTFDGNPSSAVAEHSRMKTCHVLKCISFVKKNIGYFYLHNSIYITELYSKENAGHHWKKKKKVY